MHGIYTHNHINITRALSLRQLNDLVVHGHMLWCRCPQTAPFLKLSSKKKKSRCPIVVNTSIHVHLHQRSMLMPKPDPVFIHLDSCPILYLHAYVHLFLQSFISILTRRYSVRVPPYRALVSLKAYIIIYNVYNEIPSIHQAEIIIITP